MLATVTQASPLLVKLDGAGTASPALPLNGVSPANGARVIVELVGSVLYVVGSAGVAAGALTTDTGWLRVGTAGAPAFQNGWADYAVAQYGGAQYGGAFFRRVAGVTYMQGLIASGTASVTAFTLPVGFRRSTHPQTAVFTGFNSTAAVHRFDVHDTGEVLLSISAPAWASIACSFPAEQ